MDKINFRKLFLETEYQTNGHNPEDFNIRKWIEEITLMGQSNLEKWQPLRANDKHLLQVIDFFSGAGGMSLGFAALSMDYPLFNIVGGIDIDEAACQTFERNFGVPGFRKNIVDLYRDEALFNELLHDMSNYNPNIPTVVIGCPPCQGFTSHRKKNWDINDDRNSLVGVFAELAVKLDPICVVMENVPEMLSNKYWNHFDAANKIFTQSGYIVKQTIINSAAFGVPQERFRSVVFALKKDFNLPRPLLNNRSDYVTVRKAIGDLPTIKPGIPHESDPMHRCANHKKSTIETIRAVPKDGGKRPNGVGPKCLDKVNGFSDVYGRLYWDRPSITLTRYARNPASGRYVHPEHDRGLSMREAALLQSFPNGFEFTGSFDTVFKQIGEAVPPKLAVGIASTILSELVSSSPSSDEFYGSFSNIVEPVSNSYSSVIAGIKNGRNSK